MHTPFKPTPISATMIDTLHRMSQDPNGEIILQASMFWSPRNTPTHPASGMIHVPTWWVGHRTIIALLRRGLVKRVPGRLGENRSTVALTEHGRAVLVVLEHEGRLPSTAPSTGPGSASVAGGSTHASGALQDGAGPHSSEKP